ncbi:MAG TPA: polyprenyl synthetase family protein, partial [Micromonosporaceae bacterium]|nr:polyprenyl synthetase family protein [Micromonosporaceae bacterium]
DSVLAGGKRLRPVFAYWGWRGLARAGEPAEPLLPALASLELLHAFALVHDDVMDDSDLRRGRLTAHRRLAADHAAAGRRGDPNRFGYSAAVLVGDLCLVWADRLMANGGVPALAEARGHYDQMRIDAVAGQYLDLLGDADPGAWSVERALRVARHKTASYTVHRPLRFGAALAGERARSAPRRAAVLQAFDRYGVTVGEAFQLRDDLLGAFGDPRVTGKGAGDDLRTGKPTTLMMLARRMASRAQRRELDREAAAAAGEAGEAAVARLAALLVDTGAAERVEAMIDQRVTTALAALDAAPVPADARHALRRLARAATRRRA